jgi:hypothetical protein
MLAQAARAPSRSLSELRASCEVLMNGRDHY